LFKSCSSSLSVSCSLPLSLSLSFSPPVSPSPMGGVKRSDWRGKGKPTPAQSSSSSSSSSSMKSSTGNFFASQPKIMNPGANSDDKIQMTFIQASPSKSSSILSSSSKNPKAKKKPISPASAPSSPSSSAPTSFDFRSWIAAKMAKEISEEEKVQLIYEPTPPQPKFQTFIIIRFKKASPFNHVKKVGQRICNLVSSTVSENQVVLKKTTICIPFLDLSKTEETLHMLCQHEEQLSKTVQAPFSTERM